ncbi:MAG: ATP synthase F0 subunit B [Bdellovibrionales bacterium]|nr:ATP synthase F0 subunit B [Bdellovibrionales bacterium]
MSIHYKLIALAVFTLVSQLTFAASGGGHGESHGVPWVMVLQQVTNFAIAIGIIVYFAGGSIGGYFKNRREEFTQLLKKAEEAKSTAERKKREVSDRLSKLTSTKDQTLAEAKSEAEAMKKRILDEATSLSERLEKEAHRTASFEAERAKLRLRTELLEKSMNASKESLPGMVDGSKSTVLNNQFVEKLQVSQ